MPALPGLKNLYERHRGLTKPLCESYAEAAAVCMQAFRSPPTTMDVSSNGDMATFDMLWEPPSERVLGAWADLVAATEHGAYAVALSAAEAKLGLLAVRRTERKTGADYWVDTAPQPLEGDLDLEAATRLEISGIFRCDSERVLRQRLLAKVRQVLAARLPLPALAAVVGFSNMRVAFERVSYVA
jgi:hypothetical protein